MLSHLSQVMQHMSLNRLIRGGWILGDEVRDGSRALLFGKNGLPRVNGPRRRNILDLEVVHEIANDFALFFLRPMPQSNGRID